MVTESGPEVVEGNATGKAGTQNGNVLKHIADEFRVWNRKGEEKVDNSCIKLSGGYPLAKKMATADDADKLNSSNFPEFCSRVLFGCVSLRPFRDMEEESMEDEKYGSREDEGSYRKRRKKDDTGKF
ncbi:hypothetical protein DAKH74_037690 [Maudiozyma humilis]|uniref:Uncharacterized protein n=1 Tax=Maudiozyma humilis TaxID=51915 RepID=A0AAV5S0A5_MAUHU|nr:hypothetical protein DAKH74_037690 [Kazachstania humilis]